MQTVDQVLQVIQEIIRPSPPRRLPLAQAQGSILAEVVRMDEDSPPFDRAQLDGFAIRSQDAVQGAQLSIVGHVNAGGATFKESLKPGECVGINTGGLLPAGADGVLMVEHAETNTGSAIGNFICVKKAVGPGYGIQRRGSDVKAGSIVLEMGTKLGAAQLAVCAAAGIGDPSVRTLRIAVLTTGDELMDVLDRPSLLPNPSANAIPSGKIRNTNRPMLCALARDALDGAGAVLDLGTCGDDAPLLRKHLQQGLEQADLLIVCGGMSMGTRDLVPSLLKELGVAFHVEKVRMKPGKPFVLGTWQHGSQTKYVAGLPGNPVSAFVTFTRFVREVIGHMLGQKQPALPLLRARTATPLEANADREFYRPCILRQEGPIAIAEVLGWKGSADLFSLARANALLVRPINAPPAAAGDDVNVISLAT